jgi:hypothetical protein
MAHTAEKKMTGKPMVNEIITLHLFEKGLLDERDIPLLAVRETFQYRRRIVQGANKPDFRDVELFGSLQEDVPRQQRVTQLRGHFFGDFFSA